MALQLYQHMTSDFSNKYANSTLKNTYYVAFYMDPAMNDRDLFSILLESDK